jgi:DNA invertase Pin-like site-specific DNA recombinase
MEAAKVCEAEARSPQSRRTFHQRPHDPQGVLPGRRVGPDVDPFVLHLFAALAEKERALISTRTRQALEAAKARGVALGSPKLHVARRSAVASIQAEADRHAANILPIIKEAQRAGATTLRQIADALNARGIATARGGKWHATSVKNILDRATQSTRTHVQP